MGVVKRENWKRIINIGTISGIISIVLVFSDPGSENDLVLQQDSSNLTGPLSMLVDWYFYRCNGIERFVHRCKLLKFALIKLLAVPVAAMLLYVR